jgi:hypothetical protein
MGLDTLHHTGDRLLHAMDAQGYDRQVWGGR